MCGKCEPKSDRAFRFLTVRYVPNEMNNSVSIKVSETHEEMRQLLRRAEENDLKVIINCRNTQLSATLIHVDSHLNMLLGNVKDLFSSDPEKVIPRLLLRGHSIRRVREVVHEKD